jgi:hypothetical protein
MAIFLLILKIIGIILLIILGIVIFLLLILLFMPFRYRIKGNYNREGFKLSGDVFYFFKVLNYHIAFDNGMTSFLRILNFKLFEDNDENEEEEISEDEVKESIKKEELESEVSKEEVTKPTKKEEFKSEFSEEEAKKLLEDANKAGNYTEVISDQKVEETVLEKDLNKEDLNKEDLDKEDLDKEDLDKEDLDKKVKKEKPFYIKIRDKLLDLKNKKETLSKEFNDKRNRRAVKLLYERLKKLLKHYFPKKLSGNIEFGFSEPNLTGEVLGYMSIFLGLFEHKLEIVPYFNKQIMDIDLNLEGRVRLIHLLIAIIVIILSKDVRRLYKKIKAWR